MVQLISGMSTYLKPKLLQTSVEPVMNTIHSCSRLGWSNLHLRSIYVANSLIVNASTYGPVHEVVADWPWVVDASGSSLTPAAVASALMLICTQTTIPKQFRPWMSDKRLKIVRRRLHSHICCGCIKFLAHPCRSRSCPNGYPSAHRQTAIPKPCRPWMTNKSLDIFRSLCLSHSLASTYMLWMH